MLEQLVQADNDATLPQLAERLQQQTQLQVSLSTISRALQKLGSTRKKSAGERESLTGWSTLDEPETAIAPQFLERVIAPPNQETDVAGAIVEAQEWIVAEDGTVRLIAVAPASAAQTSATCQSSENR